MEYTSDGEMRDVNLVCPIHGRLNRDIEITKWVHQGTGRLGIHFRCNACTDGRYYIVTRTVP
ncbi:MAG: hypothetical protein ABR867_04000 [Nitrososphaerales archaeon]|jgi:hypothetical protein